MAHNKVVYGGTTLIDITSTTAVASDVAQGKTFFLADGTQATGTATGGSGAVVVTEEPDTGGGVVKNITAVDISNDTVDAAHLLQGYTAHDSSGDAITGTYTPPVQQTQTKSATPTESAQTIEPDSGYLLSSVTVGAIDSEYVGSDVTRRSGSDLTASGASVSVPSGYYASNASKAVQSGSEGTPTATKGTVSNHSVTVTPSVTNTEGYIGGGTHTGTGVSVSASELVSGTYNVTSSGTKDVTNYASASIPAGTEGTPTATKGTVSNHSITVTPSVTNSGGYISGGTKTGTGVSVSASELVSGSETKTANGTYDVTNLASLIVNVPTGSTKNIQVYRGYDTSSSTSYTATDVTLTVAKTGTYNVSWMGYRNTTSGTNGSQLYVNGTSRGSAQTTFVNSYGQSVSLTNQSFNQGDVLVVRARARSTSYVMGVGNLIIEEV